MSTQIDRTQIGRVPEVWMMALHRVWSEVRTSGDHQAPSAIAFFDDILTPTIKKSRFGLDKRFNDLTGVVIKRVKRRNGLRFTINELRGDFVVYSDGTIFFVPY
jgi:hypothetical protein